jgi:predicted RNA binding protein YcfA (HicA-like mRNA interferase family)
MKSADLIRHLRIHSCQLHKEGGNHSVYINLLNKKLSSVPRHREVKNNLVRKICKDLEIPLPTSFQ